MPKRILLIALLLLVAGAASAQANAVFPPLDAGKYTIRVQNPNVLLDADGIPLTPEANSVGVFDELAPDVLLLDPSQNPACVDNAAGDTVSISFVVPNPINEDRAKVRARAFEGAGCVGQTSTGSVRPAVVFFVGPPAPLILDPEPVVP